MIKGLLRYFDVAYFLRFALLFVSLYYCHILFNGVISREGNYYSPFLDHYLNYIQWFTLSILHSAKFILQTVGVNSYIEGSQVLKAPSGLGVNLWLPCLGLGIISFWIAYIVSQKTSLKKKIGWCLGGITAIWFINCLRIALLLLSLENGWGQNKVLDHHEVFNLAAYAVIFTFIVLFNRQEQISNRNQLRENASPREELAV